MAVLNNHPAEESKWSRLEYSTQSNLPDSYFERIRKEEQRLLREEGDRKQNNQREGKWRFYGPGNELIAECQYEREAEHHMRSHAVKTHVFLTQYPVCDTPFDAIRSKRQASGKKIIEKLDGLSWTIADPTDRRMLPQY